MEIVGIILVVFLVAILLFVITRWFWNWYFKINARLQEQRRTNELLQNIYNALIQGNQVSAVTAGQIMNMKTNKAEAPTVVAEVVAEQ